MVDAAATTLSKKPDDTPFKQQRLASWQPVLTPIKVIIIFIIVGIIFVPVGTTLIAEANSVYDSTIIYDGTNVDASTDCEIQESNQGKKCFVNFTISEDVDGPLYVYYNLKNYYQNHRRYVKSRSALQLEGTNLAESAVSLDCDPLVKNGTLLLNPCGLIANSFFTDIITLVTPGRTLDESGISWSSDNSRFSQVDGFFYEQVPLTTASSINDTFCSSYLGVSPSYAYPYDGMPNAQGEMYCFYYPDNDSTQYLYETYPQQISPIDGVTDEHFIVWMRTAGLPSFRKLYGQISGNFQEGDTLSFLLDCNFEVDSYDASKGITISTLGSMGGKNPFIGVAYVVVGSISFFLALLFGAKYFLDPRRQGNAESLHWD